MISRHTGKIGPTALPDGVMVFGELRRLAGNFRRDRRANVAMIFAFLLIPVLFAAGMGVDYATAARRRAKLDSAADSAALAAVTPAIMSITTQSAQQAAMTTAATNMFNTLASQVSGLQSVPTPTINICPGGTGCPTGMTQTVTVTVSYSAQSLTTFSGIIGRTAIAIGGHSQASASTQQPYINFYLLLDDSPSMAIAATTAGINTMIANTPTQDKGGTANQANGCAFACHESSPSSENPPLGNPGGEDNYALAKSLGVTVRMDLLRTAVQNLMTTAQSYEGTNSYYNMSIYTFDDNLNTIQAPTYNLTAAQTAAANIQLQEVYSNNYITAGTWNNDTNTDFVNVMSNTSNNIISIMGSAGNGSATSPQKFLFLVTDGVEDYASGGNPSNRVYSAIDTSYCTTIKNAGIKIAVLYTEYLPLPIYYSDGTTKTWYGSHVAPIQSTIEPALQTCASPGLYSKVTTDSDISAALATLFNAAVTEAHLTQ